MKKALSNLVVIFIIIIGTATIANSSQIVNYQGYLTDSDGAPVADNDYQITFTLYDGGGVNQWTSDEQTVPISSGVFTYNLGSSVPIPSSVFENTNLYLGIKIGDDPEILPKTLLTSAPKSATAQNLYGGSIETRDGELYLYDANGDTAMVFIAGYDSHVIRVHPPDPCHPPEPCIPAIELYANNENRVSIFSPDLTDGREMITMQSSASEGTNIVGFNPQPEPPGIPAFLLGFNGEGKGVGSYLRFYNPATDHLGEQLVSLNTDPTIGGRLSFYDPTPPPDDSRELMTVGHMASSGIGLVGFNPQPEPPGTFAFELTVEASSKGPGGNLAIYNPNGPRASLAGGFFELRDEADNNNPSAMMEITSSYSMFNMFGATPAVGEPPAITMMVDNDSAKVGIGTSSPSEALHVVGNIALTGEMVVITDTKLKSNIRPIGNAVGIVKSMNGARYNYKYNEYPKMQLSQRDQIGLLAQDVEKVLPELVFEDKEGTKYVAYTKLTAVLIEAIKEQQKTIDELQKRIELLEKK